MDDPGKFLLHFKESWLGAGGYIIPSPLGVAVEPSTTAVGRFLIGVGTNRRVKW